MAVTLVSTLSDQYSNSYVDVAYCDAFWVDHYSTVKALQWAALTTAQKTLLLIKACRVVETARFTERNLSWTSPRPSFDHRRRIIVAGSDNGQLPVRYDFNQALQFPRNIDRDLVTGDPFIPEPVKQAQCEQAVYTLNFDDSVAANRMQGITEDHTAVGSVRLVQKYGSGSSSGSSTEWSPSALEYIRPFLLKSSSQVRRS